MSVASNEAGRKLLHRAGMAQLLGTFIALIGALYLGCPILDIRPSPLTTRVFLHVSIPLALAFLLAFAMLVRSKSANEAETKAWIRCVLFVDPWLLCLMVHASGGAEGNIFGPIFFLLPVCATALRMHLSDWAYVYFIAVLTAMCYGLSTYLHVTRPVVSQIDGGLLAAWIVLAWCILVSVWASHRTIQEARM